MMKSRGHSFLRRHSLSIVSSLVLLGWITLYIHSNPNKHWGGLFGNAIADWTGMVVTILATKFMYEKGSTESRRPPKQFMGPLRDKLRDHSLTIFLGVTGAGWITLYARMDSNSKWGQVVGNIVSEWTQILGLLILTKKLIETRSKESRH
jgi:hypothetical protein